MQHPLHIVGGLVDFPYRLRVARCIRVLATAAKGPSGSNSKNFCNASTVLGGGMDLPVFSSTLASALRCTPSSQQGSSQV